MLACVRACMHRSADDEDAVSETKEEAPEEGREEREE